MNQQDDLDRILGDWLATDRPRDTSARVARAAISEASRTRRLRPLPRLLRTWKGDPLDTTLDPRPGSLIRPIAVLAALLALLAGAGLIIGAARLGLPILLPQQPALLLASPAAPAAPLLAWDARGEIIIGTADGRAARHLTTDADRADLAPTWSPDGSRLAFWSYDDNTHARLRVADLRTDSILMMDPLVMPHLSDPGGGPAWSPDGRFIAYASGNRQDAVITVIDAAGEGPVATLEVPGRGVYDPVYSPDGSLLTFAASVPGDLVERWVADVAPDGTPSSPRMVSHRERSYPGGEDMGGWLGNASFARATWSADSTTIHTSAGTREGGGIVTIAADGSRQEFGVPDGGWEAPAPDGTRMAYLVHVKDGPEQGRLVLSSATYSDPVDVETPSLVYSLPSWSADGRLVALRAAMSDGVVIVTADGSAAPIQIPGTAVIGDPTFQPQPFPVPGLQPTVG